MSLSLYQASVPVFVRGLNVLAALLEKAESHAREAGIDPAELVNARLAPDMYPLSGQIQRASDASSSPRSVCRGSRRRSFPTMKPRWRSCASAWHHRLSAGAWRRSADGAESRKVTLSFGDFKPEFQGDAYLLSFALPNFYFHVATAYGILRNQGVKIGKLDFLGPYPGLNPA